MPVLECGHAYLKDTKGMALEKDDTLNCEECDKPQPKELDISFDGRETQTTITEWAEKTFGPAGNSRLAARANKEMAELLMKVTAKFDDPGIPEEIADVFICLYRLASQHNVDVDDIVDAKMKVNRARKWEVDAHGCGQHI